MLGLNILLVEIYFLRTILLNSSITPRLFLKIWPAPLTPPFGFGCYIVLPTPFLEGGGGAPSYFSFQCSFVCLFFTFPFYPSHGDFSGFPLGTSRFARLQFDVREKHSNEELMGVIMNHKTLFCIIIISCEKLRVSRKIAIAVMRGLHQNCYCYCTQLKKKTKKLPDISIDKLHWSVNADIMFSILTWKSFIL